MDAHGYRMNLFNHWANARDENVYFTFPTRGEDLIAIGTIADGVIGDYHYRHPIYARYLNAVTACSPGLDGGLRRTPLENAIHPLTTGLMAGTIPGQLVPRLAGLAGTDGLPLVHEWLDRRLVRPGPGGSLQLTGSGSWFNGNMVRELTRAWSSAHADLAVAPGAPLAAGPLAAGRLAGGVS